MCDAGCSLCSETRAANNLLSVTQATNAGKNVVFEKECFKIMFNRKIIAFGRRMIKLYILNTNANTGCFISSGVFKSSVTCRNHDQY